jgi:hypothetical protein
VPLSRNLVTSLRNELAYRADTLSMDDVRLARDRRVAMSKDPKSPGKGAVDGSSTRRAALLKLLGTLSVVKVDPQLVGQPE